MSDEEFRRKRSLAKVAGDRTEIIVLCRRDAQLWIVPSPRVWNYAVTVEIFRASYWHQSQTMLPGTRIMQNSTISAGSRKSGLILGLRRKPNKYARSISQADLL